MLAKTSPFKFTHIMHKTNVNNIVLKEYLDYLIIQNLVEKQTIGKKRVVFRITERGLTLLKQFRAIQQAIPEMAENESVMIEENTRANGVEKRFQ